MSEHWSNGNDEPRPLRGRFAAEVEQGLRCRHERRWEDHCSSCGRAGGQPPGVLLLGLSDEVASLQCQLTTRADEYATELEDLQTRIGEMDVDLAAAEADKEHLAKYLAERNREVTELKAEVLALRRECVATGDAGEAAVQAAKRMKTQRDEARAKLEVIRIGIAAIPFVKDGKP